MKSATRGVIAVMGALAGLMGIEHGIGAILQGSRPPAGVMYPSWPESAFMSSLAGEPAMTVVPNLLVTGILAVLLSLAFILLATRFFPEKHGGLVLILVSILMLLAGAGFGPPLLGILLGLTATRIDAPPARRALLPVSLRQRLGALWPWIFGSCLAAWLFLFPGVPLLDVLFGVDDPNLILAAVLLAFVLLLAAILAGFARDSVQSRGLSGSSIG